MLVNPAAPAVLPPPTLTPATQAAFSNGAALAQNAVPQAPTQTAQAPAATTRGEQSNASQSRAQQGRRFDTLANSIDAQTDRRAARGSLMDLRA